MTSLNIVHIEITCSADVQTVTGVTQCNTHVYIHIYIYSSQQNLVRIISNVTHTKYLSKSIYMYRIDIGSYTCWYVYRFKLAIYTCKIS